MLKKTYAENDFEISNKRAFHFVIRQPQCPGLYQDCLCSRNRGFKPDKLQLLIEPDIFMDFNNLTHKLQ